MKAALLSCLALSLALAPPARADDPPADPAEAPAEDEVTARLERGLASFQDLEYSTAIETLRPLRTEPRASRAQRLQALELIGISHLILREDRAAEAAFRDLLAVDPGYELHHDDGSPKIRRTFERIRRELAPGAAPGTVRLDHAAPTGVSAGDRAELEAVVLPGGQAPAEILVRWRRRGQLSYGEKPLREVEDGRWRGRLALADSERDYIIEYYLEARGLADAPVGRVGGPDTPLVLEVEGSESGSKPWYGRWYVWAGGAAVLGLGAAIAVSSAGGTPDGTLDPGRITLTP